ncbi:MAG TPA: hypothetical protein VMU34_06805 [Mycobacterium sp.]|nr:hypothetical protein [Mycobacterium sp.]
MSHLKTLYGGLKSKGAVVDLITAVVYGLVVLAVLIALGIWWLFPILLAVLLVTYALRWWWAKVRAAAPK